MRRFAKYIVGTTVLIFFLIIGIRSSKVWYIKKTITQNMWYISNVVNYAGSHVEPSNDINFMVFDFKDNNSYKVYRSMFPKFEFASLYYYGNESFKVTRDSLIMDDYMKIKLLEVCKDSITFEYLTRYVVYNNSRSPYYEVKSELLVYTIKPIYINPVSDSMYGRRDRSYSKPTTID